jgi:hypothetical protein
MKAPVFKFVFGAIVALSIFSAIVMLLWNALVPVIFGLTAISFWQALGLFALSHLLFSGFGGRGMFALGGLPRGKNPIREKWLKMTLEERKEFMKHRHSFHDRIHLHEIWLKMTPEERKEFMEHRHSFGDRMPFGQHHWEEYDEPQEDQK